VVGAPDIPTGRDAEDLHDLGAVEVGTQRVELLLGRQYGDAELDAMRSVKAVLDPAGIMNPGKRLPEAGTDSRRGMYADVA